MTGLALAAASLIGSLKRRAATLSLPGLSLPARHVQIVQALPVGPGARLLVVDFGERRLLIGQSRAGLATLADQAAEQPLP